MQAAPRSPKTTAGVPMRRRRWVMWVTIPNAISIPPMVWSDQALRVPSGWPTSCR